MLSSSQAIADEVAGNPDAIGYYGMGYISAKQKPVAIAKDAESRVRRADHRECHERLVSDLAAAAHVYQRRAAGPG